MIESNLSSHYRNINDYSSSNVSQVKTCLPFTRSNNAFADSALNIYDRNTFSNYQSDNAFSTTYNLFFQKRDKQCVNNNYLAPLDAINKSEKTTNESNLLNPRLYQTMRNKMNNQSKQVDTNNYEKLKKDETKINPLAENNYKILEDNILSLNKYKRKTGVFLDENRSKTSATNTDSDKTSLYVLSRFQKWITVTPRSKSRKFPLEKQKEEKIQKSSKLLPEWMNIDNKTASLTNQMIPKEYTYNKEKKKKKFTILIDKENINQEKSVFSLGDFRHNVVTKGETESNMINLQRSPKRFNQWMDKDIYHPKFKKDVNQDQIEKFKKEKEEAIKKLERKLKNNYKFKF